MFRRFRVQGISELGRRRHLDSRDQIYEARSQETADL